MTGFHTFVKKQKSISFPEESFDSGGRSAAEKEQGIRVNGRIRKMLIRILIR